MEKLNYGEIMKNLFVTMIVSTFFANLSFAKTSTKSIGVTINNQQFSASLSLYFAPVVQAYESEEIGCFLKGSGKGRIAVDQKLCTAFFNENNLKQTLVFTRGYTAYDLEKLPNFESFVDYVKNMAVTKCQKTGLDCTPKEEVECMGFEDWVDCEIRLKSK